MIDTKVRTDFPREVREIENIWIPMPDGVQLAARIWLPEDAVADPVPAILEYLPYRKRDGTVARDHLTHPYFAGFGYAGVRVDMRGTGDSEGVCKGEYLLQEQDDCLAVMEWLSNQPWCSGKVGMIGISWGGFNGLQVAARRPPQLGAVISLCSTDDRYADDIHFMGGAMLGEKLGWGATAFTIANTPPDPLIVGERWRDMWIERLRGNGLWLLDWLKHQRRDEFYAHGSICENYDAVAVPVYLVGGWADGYTNAILRMLENLSCPKKGLIGPWAHKYPHFALPGPRIGFLQECLRWWDQHLKGRDTGIMDEPELRAWVNHSVEPRPYYESRPGHWVAVPKWQGGESKAEAKFCNLDDFMTSADGAVSVACAENAGYTSGNWCGYGLVPDGPIDQSLESSMISFETEPFESEVELLGFPQLTAEVQSDVPQANLIAVLSEALPDGKANRISYGILNLSHRNSHANPQALPKDEPVAVQVQLNACGQCIAKGSQLRLSLSNAYWPVVWPSPQKAKLKLTKLKLMLPVSTVPADEGRFCEAEGAAPLETEVLVEGSFQRGRNVDYVTGVEICRTANDTGLVRHLHTDMETREESIEEFSIHPDDPNSAMGKCAWAKRYGRGNWRADVETSVTIKALSGVWELEAQLKAVDAEGVVYEKSWCEQVPRDLV